MFQCTWHKHNQEGVETTMTAKQSKKGIMSFKGSVDIFSAFLKFQRVCYLKTDKTLRQ